MSNVKNYIGIRWNCIHKNIENLPDFCFRLTVRNSASFNSNCNLTVLKTLL